MRALLTTITVLLTASIMALACLSCGSGVKQPSAEPPPVPKVTVTHPDSAAIDSSATGPTTQPATATPSPVAPRPVAPPPMLDGLVGDAEWGDEYEFTAGWNDGQIWIRPFASYTYMCVATTDTGHTGLNLYIENAEDQVVMLHASYAHGYRYLSSSHWQEMKWGPAGLWTSNLIESVIRNGQRVYIMPEAFEFQISETILPAGGFRFMLQFERPERWVPETADTLSRANWFHYTGNPTTGS